MGLVDTIENNVPICSNPTPNHADYSPPKPTQSTTSPNNGRFPSNNYRQNSNAPYNYSYPSHGHPPAYVPQSQSSYGSYNSGGNTNGSGIQKNGDVKVGNRSQKTGGVKIGSIGSNVDNQGGQQVVGDVRLGNIG